MTGVRAPTLAELAVILRDLPDGPERTRLEACYWAKAIDRYGPRRAAWYREEHQRLRANREAVDIVNGLRGAAA